MSLTLEAYRKDPCRAAPFFYARSLQYAEMISRYARHCSEIRKVDGEPESAYFRLKHDLAALSPATLPNGFKLIKLNPVKDSAQVADCINACYPDMLFDAETVAGWRNEEGFHPSLWIGIQSEDQLKLVASGIAQFDPRVPEAALDWIQVMPGYQRRGLGSFLVKELLNRSKQLGAQFVTVAGEKENPANPEALYRRNGFTGNEIWYFTSPNEEA